MRELRTAGGEVMTRVKRGESLTRADVDEALDSTLSLNWPTTRRR